MNKSCYPFKSLKISFYSDKFLYHIVIFKNIIKDTKMNPLQNQDENLLDNIECSQLEPYLSQQSSINQREHLKHPFDYTPTTRKINKKAKKFCQLDTELQQMYLDEVKDENEINWACEHKKIKKLKQQILDYFSELSDAVDEIIAQKKRINKEIKKFEMIKDELIKTLEKIDERLKIITQNKTELSFCLSSDPRFFSSMEEISCDMIKQEEGVQCEKYIDIINRIKCQLQTRDRLLTSKYIQQTVKGNTLKQWLTSIQKNLHLDQFQKKNSTKSLISSHERQFSENMDSFLKKINQSKTPDLTYFNIHLTTLMTAFKLLLQEFQEGRIENHTKTVELLLKGLSQLRKKSKVNLSNWEEQYLEEVRISLLRCIVFFQ